MDKLPNLENAVIDIRKLRAYCLNANHPVGKHKARVFKSKLGIDQDDAEWLKQLILSALPDSQSNLNFKDQFGTRCGVTTFW
jgi:hypothetical protein